MVVVVGPIGPVIAPGQRREKRGRIAIVDMDDRHAEGMPLVNAIIAVAGRAVVGVSDGDVVRSRDTIGRG